MIPIAAAREYLRAAGIERVVRHKANIFSEGTNEGAQTKNGLVLDTSPLDISSLNGNRTRISALRGPRPKPLDDKAVLPRKDSNLDKQIQSLLSCH